MKGNKEKPPKDTPAIQAGSDQGNGFKLLTPPNTPQHRHGINYGIGETITVLHVAEKPSIAQSIAKGLASDDVIIQSRKLPAHVFSNPVYPHAPKAALQSSTK